jgi:uncharacterized protein (TIGR02594 family)
MKQCQGASCGLCVPQNQRKESTMLARLLSAGAVALAIAATPAAASPQSGHHVKAHPQTHHVKRHIARHKKYARRYPAPSATASLCCSSDLVSAARRYIGTNPTGRRTLWCGAFMAMIAPDAARRVRNPNMALSWAALPHVAPRIGAIAVLGRRGGGHVGVVTGFDGRGNPIIVSGNHNHRVGEGVYSASRVRAYVSA